jgi:hypothetical protein
MNTQPENETFGGMAELTPEPTPTAWTPDVPQWIAVISIVIGVLGILCWGGQGVMAITMAGQSGVPDMATPTGGHAIFEMFGYVSATILGLWLIVAGSGAAAGKDWARKLLRSWAWTRIVIALIGVVGAFIYIDDVVALTMETVNEQMTEAASQGESPANVPAVTDTAMWAIMTIWIIVVTVAICIWPTLVLIVTRRRGEA